MLRLPPLSTVLLLMSNCLMTTSPLLSFFVICRTGHNIVISLLAAVTSFLVESCFGKFGASVATIHIKDFLAVVANKSGAGKKCFNLLSYSGKFIVFS
jgi:hypothetical protein